MIAVIFEAKLNEGRHQDYLDIASDLRPLLEEIDGFISIERFESLATPNKILSLSFWRDEAAVARWRQIEKHRNAQQEGRDAIFSDYRLRVACIRRDYGPTDRTEAPEDSKIYHG